MNDFRNAVFVFLIVLSSAFGQTGRQQRLPLIEILEKIEAEHQVKFNYLNEAIQGKLGFIPTDKNLTLPSKLRLLSVQTNLDFSITSPGIVVITARKELTQQQKDSIAVLRLEEVVVSSYLTSGVSRRINGSFAISPPEFGLLPGLIEADVLQTMQQIPGIISVDETISNINIRGGTHDQNLFLWNGIRMFQTGHFFGQISAFNPSIPQRISIYKNGTPAAYGESVSGMADIATQTDIGAADIGEISTNLISAQAFARLKLWKNAAMTLSGRRSLTDFFSSPAYESYSDRVFQNTVVTNLINEENIRYATSRDFYFYDLSLQLHQKIGEKHDLTLSGILIENELSIGQSRYQATEVLNRRSILQQSSWGVSGQWKFKESEERQWTAKFATSHFLLNGLNSSIQSNQALSQQNEVLSITGGISGRQLISDQLSIEGAYDFTEAGIENYDSTNLPDFERNDRRVMRSHALSGQASWNSENGKWSVKPGVRLNYFGRARLFRAEPRLNASFQAAPRLRLELLSEFKSQSAVQVIDYQQDFLGLEKRRWVLTNEEDIPIEKSHQSSIGMIYDPKDWLVTVEAYYKKVDGIYTGSQSFQNQLEFQRIIGSYTVFGAEFLAQRKWGKMRSWLSYSVNRNDYDFPTYNPERFPNNFHIAHAMACAGIYEYEDLKVALGAKWYSGKPQTYPAGETTETSTIIYQSPNSDRLPSYFQMNLSGTYVWDMGSGNKFSAGLSVMNLLNRKTVINRYYQINENTSEIERIDTYSLGITPNLSMKVSF